MSMSNPASWQAEWISCPHVLTWPGAPECWWWQRRSFPCGLAKVSGNASNNTLQTFKKRQDTPPKQELTARPTMQRRYRLRLMMLTQQCKRGHLSHHKKHNLEKGFEHGQLLFEIFQALMTTPWSFKIKIFIKQNRDNIKHFPWGYKTQHRRKGVEGPAPAWCKPNPAPGFARPCASHAVFRCATVPQLGQRLATWLWWYSSALLQPSNSQWICDRAVDNSCLAQSCLFLGVLQVCQPESWSWPNAILGYGELTIRIFALCRLEVSPRPKYCSQCPGSWAMREAVHLPLYRKPQWNLQSRRWIRTPRSSQAGFGSSLPSSLLSGSHSLPGGPGSAKSHRRVGLSQAILCIFSNTGWKVNISRALVWNWILSGRKQSDAFCPSRLPMIPGLLARKREWARNCQPSAWWAPPLWRGWQKLWGLPSLG